MQLPVATVRPLPPTAAPARPPVVRAQSPEEPAPPARLVMPSPESLGIAARQTAAATTAPPTATSPALDWNDVDRRLKALHAVCSQRQQRPEGGHRFLFLLPGDNPERMHRVEAVGDTEAEAVSKALAAAEQFVRSR